VTVLDQRTGGLLERWHAHEAPVGVSCFISLQARRVFNDFVVVPSQVVNLFPYGPSQLLTVGADRTIALWRLHPNRSPTREAVVRGLPDVTTGGGVILHSCNTGGIQQHQQQLTSLMLAASGHKIGWSTVTPSEQEAKARVSSFLDLNKVCVRDTFHGVCWPVN
jgi:hypothetical protein